VHRKQVLKEDPRNIRQARLVGLASGGHRTKFLHNGFCLSNRMTGRDALCREANPPEGFDFMVHEAV
jgi:hypothetical protein